jgi:hypothetical protein
MEEKKKREAVYDPEAQKRWEQKNKDKRGRINRKSGAKRFIREDATLEELEELKAFIEEREKQFEWE